MNNLVMHIYKVIGEDGKVSYFYGVAGTEGPGGANDIAGLAQMVLSSVSNPGGVKKILFSPEHDMQLFWGHFWCRCLPLTKEEKKAFWQEFCAAKLSE